MKNLLPLLVFAFFLLLSACTTSSTNSLQKKQEKPFFDVKNFVDEEVTRLTNANLLVEKKVIYNSTEEQVAAYTADFGKELDILKTADINKPAWFDSYLVDTTFSTSGAYALNYTAMDSSLLVRNLQVDITPEGKVAQLHFQTKAKSVLAKTQQSVTYLPGLGYTFRSQQLNTIQAPVQIEVTAKWTNNKRG